MSTIGKKAKEHLGEGFEDVNISNEIAPFKVGAARDALAKEESQLNQNPFGEDSEKLPPFVVTAVKEFAEKQIRLGVLQYDRPQVPEEPDKGETPDRFKARVEKKKDELEQYELKLEAAEDWIDRHSDSPIVKQSIQAATKLKRFQGILSAKVKPFKLGEEPYQAFLDRQKKAIASMKRAAKWTK